MQIFKPNEFSTYKFFESIYVSEIRFYKLNETIHPRLYVINSFMDSIISICTVQKIQYVRYHSMRVSTHHIHFSFHLLTCLVHLTWSFAKVIAIDLTTAQFVLITSCFTLSILSIFFLLLSFLPFFSF